MSIDNIKLTAYVCQSMYPKSLICTSETVENKPGIISSPAKKKLINKSTIDSLGENEGNILFLVNNEENKFVADDEMKLLSDLLTACKISMADIALVNYRQHPQMNYQVLEDQFHPKKILAFGVTPADLELPFAIPFFQVQKFQEQLYMISPSFADFINNTGLKKLLWNSLKKIFLP